MSYTDNKQPFLKIKNGVKAPAGFHYMPNGKLMSDADHIAMFGYIEKKVKNIKMQKGTDNFHLSFFVMFVF